MDLRWMIASVIGSCLAFGISNWDEMHNEVHAEVRDARVKEEVYYDPETNDLNCLINGKYTDCENLEHYNDLMRDVRNQLLEDIKN